MTDVQTQPVPHQAIYRRWRAQTFAQVVGQEAVVETLRNAVRTNRVAHAILFVGPRGTGKTSLARILAKAINCTDLRDGDPCDACPSCTSIREGRAMDLVEIDAASNRGIDAIRELRERVNYAPTDLRRKVYILDEAHQITKDAWNALLKSLEEPPDFVVFMFASTHPQEFPPAILSRLQRFDVRKLSTDEISGKLVRILEADGRAATPGAVTLIARLAAGGMRDAESMLDQLLSSSVDELDEGRVRDLLGLADGETVTRFVDALVAFDALAGIRLLDGLEERGRDLRGFLDQVIEALRGGIVGTGAFAHPVTALAAAARRLASIDPSRAGVGGLRLQLELALFPDDGAPAPAASRGALAPAAAATSPTAQPAPDATPGPSTEPRADAAGARPVRKTGEQASSRPARDAAPEAAPDPATTKRDEAAAPGAGDVSSATRRRQSPEPEGPTVAAPTPDAAATRAPAVRAEAGPGAGAEPAPDAAAEPAPDAAAEPAPDPAAEPPPDPAAQPPPNPAAQLAPDSAAGPTPIPAAAPAPAVPPEAAPRPTVGAPATTGDMATLIARWPDVVARISAHPPTKPLIADCRPISADDGVVTLGFPESKAFLKDLLEKRRTILEEQISAVLGHPVAVRCVATNIDVAPEVPSDTEAAWILAEARRIIDEEGADPAEVG